MRATCSGKKPVDGHYVTFWRIFMKYPEILAWEQFWHDALREVYAALRDKVRSIKPNLQVGWHIWHNNFFYGDLPKQEAMVDYRERSYEQIPFTGLSGDYVYREARRAMEAAAGTGVLIWPGIDIDIPTGKNQSKSTRQGTKDAVLAAFRAGDAIRELKLA